MVTSLLLNAGAGTSLRVHAPGTKLDQIHVEPRYALKAPSFKTSKTKTKKTVQYQSGTKQVPNPFYDTKQDKVTTEEKRLVDYQKDVVRYEQDVSKYADAVAKEGDTPGTSTGAEQNLSRARSGLESAQRKVNDQRDRVIRAKEELADTPSTKEEPVYSDHTYTITTHTIDGRVDVSGELDFKVGERNNGLMRKLSLIHI